MTNNILRIPYDFYFFPDKGKPIALGKVYIGKPDLNPKILANRKDVILRQEDGTEVTIQPSGQPLRTGAGGGILFEGSPVEVLVNGNYSIRVDDSQDSQVYFFENVLDAEPLTVENAFVKYANKDEMIADEGLLSGYGAITQNYTDTSDRGGGQYLIQTLAEFGSTPDEIGDFTLANGNVATLQGETFNISQFDGDGDAAAENAFLKNVVLEIKTGESATLICDPTSGDDIQAQFGWYRSCLISGESTFFIELADGVHTVDTFIDIDGTGPDVDFRGTGTPTFIQITSIAYASVDVPNAIYQATVSIDSALPSGAVVGGPIGIQNAQGALDVASSNGGQIIQSIAGDRLSFVFHLFSPVNAPSNGLLDNTLTFGITANQVVIAKGSLIAQSTGWDGSSREGFINCLNGGRMTIRNVGIAYEGDSGITGDEHDLIFQRGDGSRFYAFDRVILAGAGDKVLRSFGGAEFFINRSYIGGAALALELFQGVSGGNNQFVRTSCGGGKTSGFTCGSASTVTFAQAPMVNCGIGFRVTAMGGSIACFPVIIHKCSTGILATQGSITGASNTEITRCTEGVDWAGGSTVVGNFTFDSNTSDSIAPGNIFFEGGIWYQSTGANGSYELLKIIDASPQLQFIDGSDTALISGNGGALLLSTSTSADNITLQGDSTNLWFFDGGTSALIPSLDNTSTLGTAGLRTSEIFSAIGAINTSDEREKTSVSTLTTDEISAAKDLSKEIGGYKWLASIAKKGDDARYHVGMTVQRAIEIMESYGLDPMAYGFICYDEWGDSPAETSIINDEEVVTKYAMDAGNRYGFRYDQLTLFIIAGIEARLTDAGI